MIIQLKHSRRYIKIYDIYDHVPLIRVGLETICTCTLVHIYSATLTFFHMY